MKKNRLQKRERNKDGDGSVEDNMAMHKAEERDFLEGGRTQPFLRCL